MDGYFQDDQDELERRIHGMMAGQELPPLATGYDVVFGNYLDGGEPAVWINLHLPADAKVDGELAKQYGAAILRLRHELVPLVPGHLALIGITGEPAFPA